MDDSTKRGQDLAALLALKREYIESLANYQKKLDGVMDKIHELSRRTPLSEHNELYALGHPFAAGRSAAQSSGNCLRCARTASEH